MQWIARSEDPMSAAPPSKRAIAEWMGRYKDAHHDTLADDPEFTRWLEEDYAPIAGGWHY
jgi:hypothetical protein